MTICAIDYSMTLLVMGTYVVDGTSAKVMFETNVKIHKAFGGCQNFFKDISDTSVYWKANPHALFFLLELPFLFTASHIPSSFIVCLRDHLGVYIV